MPWCPQCRQEYRDVVKECADCGSPLVADLGAHDAAHPESAKSGKAQSLRVIAPAAMLGAIEAWLGQNQIPSRRLPGEALEIPMAAGDRLEAGLAPVAEVERTEAELKVLGPKSDREPELPADPEILERSIDEIAADPAGLVPKLLALFAGPSVRARKRALEQLQTLDQRGVVKLPELVVWMVREGYRKPLLGLAGELSDAPPKGLATRVAAELPVLDARALELALHLLSRLPDRSIARSMLPLLSHDEPDVRAEADEVLMSLSGFDVQFDAEAEAPARARAIEQWRKWMETIEKAERAGS